jgi:hypothetical protein
MVDGAEKGIEYDKKAETLGILVCSGFKVKVDPNST